MTGRTCDYRSSAHAKPCGGASRSEDTGPARCWRHRDMIGYIEQPPSYSIEELEAAATVPAHDVSAKAREWMEQERVRQEQAIAVLLTLGYRLADLELVVERRQRGTELSSCSYVRVRDGVTPPTEAAERIKELEAEVSGLRAAMEVGERGRLALLAQLDSQHKRHDAERAQLLGKLDAVRKVVR